MNIRIGVIAEDESDVEVLEALIRLARPRARFHLRAFVGHGCGKLRRKCGTWAQQLHAGGCRLLVLLHDVDDWDEQKLKTTLQSALNGCPIKAHAIVIPVREVEAWLLSDTAAIRAAMNIKKNIRRVPNPEAVEDPKDMLRTLIYQASGKLKEYVNTTHNRRIAERLDIRQVRRCKSFHPLEKFLVSNLN